MQLGFSSNVPLRDNFCGGLYFNSLVAKPLSDLHDDSSFNFQQSNDWQKVQFNTDLLSQRHGYLYRAKWQWLKWNKGMKYNKFDNIAASFTFFPLHFILFTFSGLPSSASDSNYAKCKSLVTKCIVPSKVVLYITLFAPRIKSCFPE